MSRRAYLFSFAFGLSAGLLGCTPEGLCAASGVECEPADDKTDSRGGRDDDTGTTDITDPEAGQLSIGSDTLKFGEVAIGETGSEELTLENVGDGALTISALEVGGPFGVSGVELPLVLGKGDSETVKVTFTPVNEGEAEETLVVRSDDPDSARTRVTVAGTGIDNCPGCLPNIEVDAGTFDDEISDFFVLVGFGDDRREVWVYNTGDADLEISDIYLNNDSTGGEFTLSGGRLPVTLPPGDSYSFDITYSASETTFDIADPGRDIHICHILSNDPDTPDWTIALSGYAL